MSEWVRDYAGVIRFRQEKRQAFRDNPKLIKAAMVFYRTRPIEFINHWLDTVDPRNAAVGKPVRMPFVLFPRQEELVEFLHRLVQEQEHGLIEKARDMGASWVACGVSVWLWLFHPGSSVGWGSRKEQLVDKIGDLDSIFEKLRVLIEGLPKELLPNGFDRRSNLGYMKIINPENGATITGESGDNIGRGGRKSIYFKDESAHYLRPESIEAALADNTNVQVDISSVNGIGNVFHRRREAGAEYSGEIEKGVTNVFVMDWRDHPLKNQAWYDKRKSKAEDEGLLHLFEQEVNRNYAASVEGILVPPEWIDSAIDAHIKLSFLDDSGGFVAGQDVADEGKDKNAFTLRKGVVLKTLKSWSKGDTGETARKAVALCCDRKVSIQYDSIGVGAGVKSESNRLRDENLLPPGISFTPWNAGAGVLNPDFRIIENDPDSPKNKDFYDNLKAQASWELRLRFERTHKAVTEGHEYPASKLISIDSKIDELQTLKKELSQITMGQSGSLKMKTNKKPEGTKSPNLADSVIMCYFPLPDNTIKTSGMMVAGL